MGSPKKPSYTNTGKLIKKRLIDKNMTATQLADILGTTPQYLNKILHGERSGDKYIEDIFQILSIDKLQKNDTVRGSYEKNNHL